MTLDEAVEKCAKALLRAKGSNEQLWAQYPHTQGAARDVVICLLELGLLKLDDN
jgi:hypothetical protein